LEWNVVQNSFLIAVLLALTGSVIGLFLMIRRYSLLADALAHFSLVGVALGILLDLPYLVTGVMATLVGGITLETLRQKTTAFTDANLALLSAGGLSVALILASLKGEIWQNLGQFLFGSLLFAGKIELSWMFIIFLGVLFFLLFFGRHLLLLSIDPEGAKSQGIKVRALEYCLVILATFVIAGGIQTVGALLTGAFLVLPSLIGMQLSYSFTKTLFWSIASGVMMAVGGIFVTFLLNLPPGATIVATGVLIYILTVIGKNFGRRGS